MSSGETIEIELTDPQAAILASNEDRNLWMGGQGSGKTAGMGFLTYNFNAAVPDVMGLIAANTYSQLTNSTLKEILKTWALMGFTKYSESNPNGSYVIDRAPPKHFKPHKYIFRDNNGKLFTKNGGVMILASLDNYSALEGMELGWALLDETADTKEEAVREVITARLREKGLYKSDDGFPFSHTGTIPVNPLYVFTKPGRVDWINNYFGLDQMRDQITLKIFSQTDFFQNVTDNRFVVVSNAFLNKDNLPTNYLENRIKDLSPEDAERLIYGNPFSKTGTEYYSSFEIKTHVGKYGYLPNLPLHITFDFNVNPYMTLQVWQVKTGQTSSPYPLINFTDTGLMFSNIKPTVERKGTKVVITLKASNKAEIDKLRWNTDRFGEILEASKDEQDQLKKDIEKRYRKLLKSFL